MMKSSFRDTLSSSTSTDNDRRTVIIERTNGSFGFSLQSYGIHYRERTEVKVITYVDFVDPNGHASKAGLRSGDVIVSVNGQDIDKTMDHTTLVSLIQSCPDRIRMVVVFENCVRKVELHMKYIRLHQLLEAKARDYQEVCASEKSFLARLNKTRGIITGPGSYYTIQSSHPQAVLRRKQEDNNPQGASSGAYSYSSNSMPRQHYVQQAAMMCPTPTDTKRHRSYLACIGRQPDCNCCFRPDDKSSSPSSTINRPKTPRQPRPRSCHIPSCYNPPESDPTGDESYLIQPSRSKVNVYGGYGFGYDWSSTVNDPAQKHPLNYSPSANIPIGRPHGTKMVARNKSTEDLLSTRLQNQCYLTQSPRHQSQEPVLDSINFYTRPSLPGANTVDPNGSGQKKPLKGIIRLPRAPIINSPGESDDGGFEQMRNYRTLPSTSSNSHQ